MTFEEYKIAVACSIGSMPTPSVSCFLNLAGRLKTVFHPESKFFWLEGGPYLVQNRTYLLDAILDYSKSTTVPFDYLLWVDADQVFEIQDIKKIVTHAALTGIDAASGIYYNRRGDRHSLTGKIMNEYNDIYWLRKDDLSKIEHNNFVEIDVCGFGFFLINFAKLQKYCESMPMQEWFTEEWHGKEKYWYSGEDIMFCRKFKKQGNKIWLAPVTVGHYGGIIPEEEYRQSKATNRFQEVYFT